MRRKTLDISSKRKKRLSEERICQIGPVLGFFTFWRKNMYSRGIHFPLQISKYSYDITLFPPSQYAQQLFGIFLIFSLYLSFILLWTIFPCNQHISTNSLQVISKLISLQSLLELYAILNHILIPLPLQRFPISGIPLHLLRIIT